MRIAAVLSFVLLSSPAFAVPDGKSIFVRCSACHLPTGAGVPGAYPPLTSEPRRLALTPDGRRYLVAVVTKGISGGLTVDGKDYRGTMPAQGGLDDGAVANVLNYVTATLGTGGKAPKLFTPAEVATLKAATSGLAPTAIAKIKDAQAPK
jgi:mono/diheme cytochrome c family protein